MARPTDGLIQAKLFEIQVKTIKITLWKVGK